MSDPLLAKPIRKRQKKLSLRYPAVGERYRLNETSGTVIDPTGEDVMKKFGLAICALALFSVALESPTRAQDTKENAEDFMAFHKIEITFHQAGTTKNLPLMLSLFSDDATITSGGKTYTGKDQIKAYWQAAGTFQPQNQWVAYTPAFRIKYDVEGDTAHLYFECLYVDKADNKIAAHTNSNDTLIRANGRWLIKDMKAAAVPEL